MMSYHPPRTRNLFKKGEPFSFSRSKVDAFLNCPKCFYIDRVFGVDSPPGFPFNINSAVDTLLKREFDKFRIEKKPHPLVLQYGYDFIPFQHEMLDTWRENFKGLRVQYNGYDFSGAIDDIWINKDGELIVVDYKSTASSEPIKSIDKDYHIGYKRQVEFYQWILKQLGFKVSPIAAFVYCTGDNTLDEFGGVVKFHTNLIIHHGNTDWVQGTLDELIKCIEGNEVPESGKDCDQCKYYNTRNNFLYPFISFDK
jgi:hypothetical protein